MHGREPSDENLALYLLGGPGLDPESIVLVEGDGQSFTRSHLHTAVAELADRFATDGLSKSRVALDLSPNFRAVAAYLALLLNGNTVVVARRIDQPPWPNYLASASLDGIIRPDELELRSADAPTDLPAASPSEAPAINLFTSGTTGRPKIVEHPHRAWIHSCEAILQILPLGPTTRTALVLSLAHSFGLSVLHTHLRAGSALVCVERPEFAGDVLRALTNGRCTGLAGVPTQLRAVTAALERSPELAGDVRVDLVMQAGGRMEQADAARLLDKLLPGARLYPMYGQTEAAARIAILDDAARAEAPGAVGRALQGTEVRVVDEAVRDTVPGHEGEVVVRGPTVMSGYFDNPEATAEVLRDGWLHTGDFGHLDERGFLYVTGRRSNFIKIDGERISLEAVEYAVISTCPEVGDALASPHRTDDGLAIRLELQLEGELVTGLAELQSRARAAVRTSMGRKAVPAEIALVDTIAYTPNAKKIRPKLVY